jgi:hypothetical protein
VTPEQARRLEDGLRKLYEAQIVSLNRALYPRRGDRTRAVERLERLAGTR